MSQGPGAWLMGCICPSETRSINLTLTEWHPPDTDAAVDACPQKDIHGTYDNGVAYLRAEVTQHLGWCGCGDPDKVDELMLTYLDWLERKWAWMDTLPRNDNRNVDWSLMPTSGLGDETELLLAYIADHAGWTEHGGSVGGAWLTDGGKEALMNLRQPVR